MNLEQLRARHAEILTELRALHETIGEAEPTDEQQTRWEELDAEEAQVRQQITDGETAETRAARVAESRARLAATHFGDNTEDPLGEPDGLRNPSRANPWDLNVVGRCLHQDSPQRGGRELRARALAAAEAAPGVNARSKEHITKLLQGLDFEDDEAEGRGARTVAAHIVATSSPEYMRAWSKAMKTAIRTGQPDMNALAVLQRAASLTDAAGGYAVPLPIDPTIVLDDDGSVSPIRQISTVQTCVTDQYRIVTTGAVSASYDAESAEVSDDAPTFDKTDISIHTARAFVPFTLEIGGDFPNFTGQMGMLLRDSKMNLENTKFALGSGSGEPFGIVTALDGTSYEIFENTDDTFALSDVYDVDEELPARFSQNASWIANKKIYQAIREAGGANLDDFWANLRDGRPPQLLGHPAYEVSAMDGVITTTGAVDNFVMVLGDFRFYWIIDRVGFSMELIPHLFHTSNNLPKGQRGLFAWWRNGADAVVNRAFRLLNIRSAA
jgi:HK97 family phage major capsid protein